MAITALTPKTVSVIGATQVLTDSASAIKELIDNALDAKASAVFIELSANALDTIQVKDNGHGIAPEDRPLLCKRHCTSKIRDFDDLSTIGGTSLGFRGEALSSMAELAGAFTLTTRIEGEPVASQMDFDRKGQIIAQKSVSHAAGTTITIKDFLRIFPVRRETALRHPAKLHTKAKSLLQAYALARPNVRFSLKVLKAKNDKGNWTYAPKGTASLYEAALKILDQKAVKQCHVKHWEWDALDRKGTILLDDEGEARSAQQWRIEALLPRIGYDSSCFSNIGQYISIDDRPVSCARQTLREVVQIFKTHLKGSMSPDNSTRIINPILVMNITCPVGAYDANVEPAKDDVLWDDNAMVLTLVEAFFRDVYGEPPVNTMQPSASKPNLGQSGFDLLLSRRPPSLDHASIAKGSGTNVTSTSGSPAAGHSPGRGAPEPHSCEDVTFPPSANCTAGTRDAELSGIIASNVQDKRLSIASMDEPLFLSEEDESPVHNGISTNPSTHTKPNISFPQLPHSAQHRACQTGFRQLRFATPKKQQRSYRDDEEILDVQQIDPERATYYDLPTPQFSDPIEQDRRRVQSSSPPRIQFPLRAWGRGERGSKARRRNQDEDVSDAVGQPRESNCAGPLDSWVMQTVPSSEIGFRSSHPLTRHGENDVCSSPPQRMSIPSNKTKSGSALHAPFKPPVRRDRASSVDSSPFYQTQESMHRSSRITPQPFSISKGPEHTTNLHGLTRPSNPAPLHPDLLETLAYEERKALAMQQNRAATLRSMFARPTEGADNLRSSPHANRYAKAKAALSSAQDREVTEGSSDINVATTFPQGDPRAYLIRNLENVSPDKDGDDGASHQRKAKRTKTALLPLETIPGCDRIHNLIVPLATSSAQVDELSESTGNDELEFGYAFDRCNDADIEVWQTTLQSHLSRLFRTVDGAIEFPVTLWNLPSSVKGHMALQKSSR
ncbi:hypothetical protein MMC25_006727 [Agyrium rufum]|nr:hypothetical protein [Agyrium rufum]